MSQDLNNEFDSERILKPYQLAETKPTSATFAMSHRLLVYVAVVTCGAAAALSTYGAATLFVTSKLVSAIAIPLGGIVGGVGASIIARLYAQTRLEWDNSEKPTS